MTYRERREAKAARLRGWAEQRVERAERTLAADSGVRHDWAFITQPGHIPQRARMIARDDRALASLAKAGEMRGRAAGIEAAAANAIYSDDPDAVEALEARVARLEAEREAVVTFNKAVRKAKGVPDAAMLEALGPELARDYLRAVQYSPGGLRNGAFPAYHLSNLSGNIKRQRDRLERLRVDAAHRARVREALAAEPYDEFLG